VELSGWISTCRRDPLKVRQELSAANAIKKNFLYAKIYRVRHRDAGWSGACMRQNISSQARKKKRNSKNRNLRIRDGLAAVNSSFA
jgi:hypothetical protein